MKKHIPNAITCLNLATGSIGCIYVIQGDYHQAFYFIIIAAIFDFFDGMVARLLGVQSPIGKELDSLADMVSFGLLPALYLVMAIDSCNPPYGYVKYFGILVAIFSALRLAKFNLDTRQSDQFIGLPTPANAVMITSLSFLPTSWIIDCYTFIIFTIICCFLMIMEIPLIALKFRGLGWKSNQWRFSLIGVVLVLLAVFKFAALPFLIPSYLFMSIFGNLVGSKSV